MGPKDAATSPKKPTRLSAKPVAARSTLIVRAENAETALGILGSIVLKLFAAINEEKHVGTRDAAAKRKNIKGAKVPTLAIVSV